MSTISVVLPAYNARDFIKRSVSSVLDQTYTDIEILVISDDGVNYEDILEQQNITDSRLRFLATESIGTGASNARNIGLDNASGDIIAILDADDAIHHKKFEVCSELVVSHPLVSCAISVFDKDGCHLRDVGTNIPTSEIVTERYKHVNFSMDSMIVFDRNVIDCCYDSDFKSWNDFEFIVQCMSRIDNIYHLAFPYHHYFKQPNSISNANSSHDNYKQTKSLIKERLQNGYYDLNENIEDELIKFIDISIHAEGLFKDLKKQDYTVIFEDVIEPLLPND